MTIILIGTFVPGKRPFGRNTIPLSPDSVNLARTMVNDFVDEKSVLPIATTTALPFGSSIFSVRYRLSTSDSLVPKLFMMAQSSLSFSFMENGGSQNTLFAIGSGIFEKKSSVVKLTSSFFRIIDNIIDK